jgi:FAD:protein FMN transferase
LNGPVHLLHLIDMRRVLIPTQTSAPAATKPPAANSIVLDFRGETMGTTWSVRLVNSLATEPDWQRNWQQRIQSQLDTVVAQMSHWQTGSDLERFNCAPAGSWQILPEAFVEVLSYALEVAEKSNGAYDPTAGALINAWGFGSERRYDEAGFSPPDADCIEKLRNGCGWQRIAFEAATRKIYQPGGIRLDLSAVAKGYSVDRVAQYLENHGFSHYLIEVGGELRGAGMKPDRLPWWVALEQPLTGERVATATSLETIVALHGLSIATSGDYRRFYRVNDARISHTIDPRSGWPIQNDVASVTVLHPSCMAADALSTALTVLGAEDGLHFAEKYQLAVRFLLRSNGDFIERASAQFVSMLQ